MEEKEVYVQLYEAVEAFFHMANSMLDEPGLEIKRSRAVEQLSASFLPTARAFLQSLVVWWLCQLQANVATP